MAAVTTDFSIEQQEKKGINNLWNFLLQQVLNSLSALKTEKKNRLMNIYLASSFSWATTRITWAV
jgi:hypothetical protein